MSKWLIAAALLGQVVFRARADVVAIDVTVMDGKKPVISLTKDDFTLTDDGVAQTLLDVGREQLPLDVTLTIDVSGSLTKEKRAAIERAVNQVSDALHPDDRASIVSFGLRIFEDVPLRNPPVPLELATRKTDGTSFRDALLLSLIGARAIGRRQLNLFLTDGIDSTSFFSPALVLETMKFSSGQTSVVLVVGSGPNLGKGPTRDLIDRVTATSGGQVVELNEHAPLKQTFLSAIDEFRTSYQLRYAPSADAKPGWHSVVVSVGNGRYSVRARQGYWR